MVINEMKVYIIISGADYEEASVDNVFVSMESAVKHVIGGFKENTHQYDWIRPFTLIDDSEDYKEWRQKIYMGGKWKNACDYIKIIEETVMR